MTQTLELKAEIREDRGSAGSRRIRRQGKIPAVIYGSGEKQVFISVVANDIKKLRSNHNIMAHIFDIKVGNETYHVLPKELQYHPVTDAIEHIDFIHVKDDSIVKTSVKINIINKEKSPGIKLNGTLNVMLRKIDVSCHPREIPESIAVDIGELRVGGSIHLSDLKLPEGMKLIPKKQDLAVVVITSNRDTLTEEQTKS